MINNDPGLKQILCVLARNQEFFRAGEDFLKLGYFNKHLICNTQKNLGTFFLDVLKTIFQMRNLTHR